MLRHTRPMFTPSTMASDSSTSQSYPPRIARVWVVAIGLALLAGIAFRIRAGLLEPGLWYDEVLWYERFMTGFKRGIRAPAYAAFHYHYFKSLTVPLEYQVRLVSIVCGIAVLPLFTITVHKLFNNLRLTFLGTILLSSNVAAISFTHEFKPYSMELCLHTVWLLSLVGFSSKRASLWVSSLVLLGGLSLSYGCIPLIAFQLVFAIHLYRKREITLGDLLGCVAIFAGYLVYFLGVYPHLQGTGTKRWGRKYGVFFNTSVHGTGVSAYLTWFFAKLSTYVTYPLNWYQDVTFEDRADGFPKGHGYLQLWWLGAVYLLVLLRKMRQTRYDDPRLIPVYLLLGYTLAGILRIYPLGFFRANLFIFLYATLSLLFVLQGALTRVSPRNANLLVGLMLIPTCMSFSSQSPGEKSFYNLALAPALEEICKASQGEPVTLITDRKVAPAITFYLNHRVPLTCQRSISVMNFRNPSDLESLLQGKGDRYVIYAEGSSDFRAQIHRSLIEQHHGELIVHRGSMAEYLVRGD
ncbi:MAG: hypothetical protein RL518_1394, partial [Pseudomonadota bacterium]